MAPDNQSPQNEEPTNPLFQPFDESIVVYMEHVGGPHDGMILCSHSDNELERMMTRGWYQAHGQGAVGRAYRGPSMLGLKKMFWLTLLRRLKLSFLTRGGVQSYRYVVVERIDDGSRVVVRYQYTADPPSGT